MPRIPLTSPEGKRFALYHPQRASRQGISADEKDAFEQHNKNLAKDRLEKIRAVVDQI